MKPTEWPEGCARVNKTAVSLCNTILFLFGTSIQRRDKRKTWTKEEERLTNLKPGRSNNAPGGTSIPEANSAAFRTKEQNLST